MAVKWGALFSALRSINDATLVDLPAISPTIRPDRQAPPGGWRRSLRHYGESVLDHRISAVAWYRPGLPPQRSTLLSRQRWQSSRHTAFIAAIRVITASYMPLKCCGPKIPIITPEFEERPNTDVVGFAAVGGFDSRIGVKCNLWLGRRWTHRINFLHLFLNRVSVCWAHRASNGDAIGVVAKSIMQSSRR